MVFQLTTHYPSTGQNIHSDGMYILKNPIISSDFLLNIRLTGRTPSSIPAKITVVPICLTKLMAFLANFRCLEAKFSEQKK